MAKNDVSCSAVTALATSAPMFAGFALRDKVILTVFLTDRAIARGNRRDVIATPIARAMANAQKRTNVM